MMPNDQQTQQSRPPKRNRNALIAFFVGFVLLGGTFIAVSLRNSQEVSLNGNNTPRASLTATAPTAPIKGLAGKCLDNAGKRAEDRNKIQLYTCNGSIAQEWTHYSDGRIVNKNGFCLDVKGAATTNSTIVQLYHCHGGAAQKWTYNATNKSLRNPHSGKCLDVKGAQSADRTQIQIYTCNNGAGQRWSAPKSASVTVNSKAIVGLDSKCLDNQDAKAANDNKIMLYHCTGTVAQQWTVLSDGQIKNVNGYCLDVKSGGTTAGTIVQLYACNNTAAQKWTVNASAKTITNPQSGLCLAVKDNNPADGTQIVLGACSAAGAKWTAPSSSGGTTTPPTGGGGTTPPPTTTGYNAKVLADKPVAFWGMTNPGGIEKDVTDQGLNGSYMGGTPASATMPNGDKAVAFNGQGQYMTVPSNAKLSIPTTKELTWEAWIRPDVANFPRTSDGYVNYLGKCQNYSPSCEWEARIYNASSERCSRLSAYAFNLTAGLGSGAYWQATNCNVVKPGTWLHVVGQYQTKSTPPGCNGGQPGGLNIWVNGVKWNQAAHLQTGCMSQYGVTPQAGNSPFNVGATQMASFFQGAIGKVAIYNYLLSQTQINNHYQTMTGKTVTGACPNNCNL